MQAQDIMRRNVFTVTNRASLADAAKVMWDHNCGIIPVLDADSSRPVGIITDRDVCMGALTQGHPLYAIPVTTSMSHDLATCTPETPLEAVEATMAERRIRRLPVIDAEGRIMGLISLDDIARTALESHTSRDKIHLTRGLSKTLGLISEPEPIRSLNAMFS